MRPLSWPPACAVALCSAALTLSWPGAALAQLSAEQVQAYKDRVAMPKWQEAMRTVTHLRRAPPNQAAAQLWQALDAQVNATPGRDSAPLMNEALTREELVLRTDWLRIQVLSNRLDGRYSYAYAQHLIAIAPRGEYLNEAALFLAHARLSMSVDADRCVDPSAALDTMAEYESRPAIRALDAAVKALPPRRQAAAKLEAVILEETLGARPELPWLCAPVSGAWVLTEVPTPPGDVGRTFIQTQPRGIPRMVDTPTWQAARAKRLKDQGTSLLPLL